MVLKLMKIKIKANKKSQLLLSANRYQMMWVKIKPSKNLKSKEEVPFRGTIDMQNN